jgi:hypothetical protein
LNLWALVPEFIMIQVLGLEISCLLTSGIHLSSKQYGIINYNSRWINMAGWNWLSSSYLFRNKLRRKFNTFTIAWCWISILYNTHIKQSAVAHFRVSEDWRESVHCWNLWTRRCFRQGQIYLAQISSYQEFIHFSE